MSPGFIAKCDFNGNKVWEKSYNGYSFSDVTVVNDGIVAIGNSKLVYFDKEGNYRCETSEDNAERIVTIDENKVMVFSGTKCTIYSVELLSPEYPSAQNVIIKNKKKRVKVTTAVNGSGGTITGRNQAPYEEVIYGNDSTKEIIATPSEGYKVLKITVNGKEISFSENVDNTVTLSNFIEMTEDKHVIVEFSNTITSINTNYYLWENGTGTTTTKVSESETNVGNIGNKYSTSPKFDLEYEIITNQDYYGNKTETEILSDINTTYGTTYTSLADLGYEE